MIKKVLRNALFLGLAMTAVAGTAQARDFGGSHRRGFHDFRGGHDYFRFHDFRRHFGGGCYFDERGGRRRFCD